jgi:uncharacterized protein
VDTHTGHIYPNDTIQQLIASGALDQTRFRPMVLPPTPAQMERKPPRIGRNDPCPCGSGKKFKRCCLKDPKDERFK